MSDLPLSNIEHALAMDDSPMPMYRDAAAMMLMLNNNGYLEIHTICNVICNLTYL